MAMGFLFEVMEKFWNYLLVTVLQHCEYATSHWIVYFKMVILYYMNFTVILKN